jgi:hypothetical protein
MKDLMGFRYRSFTVLAACHANLVLHAVCVACCNSCLVYYVLGHAFFLEWACDLDCQTVIYIYNKKAQGTGADSASQSDHSILAEMHIRGRRRHPY